MNGKIILEPSIEGSTSIDLFSLFFPLGELLEKNSSSTFIEYLEEWLEVSSYPMYEFYRILKRNIKKKEQYYGSIEHQYFSEFTDEKGNTLSSNIVYFSFKHNKCQDNEPNGLFYINVQELLDYAKKSGEQDEHNPEIETFCSIVKDWVKSDLFTMMMRERYGKGTNLDDIMVPIAVNRDCGGDFPTRLVSAVAMGDDLAKGNEKGNNKIVKLCIFEPLRDGGYLDPGSL